MIGINVYWVYYGGTEPKKILGTIVSQPYWDTQRNHPCVLVIQADETIFQPKRVCDLTVISDV